MSWRLAFAAGARATHRPSSLASRRAFSWSVGFAGGAVPILMLFALIAGFFYF